MNPSAGTPSIPQQARPTNKAAALAKARDKDGRTYYYEGLLGSDGREGAWTVDGRWSVIEPYLDLRPTDHALDLGCAEGLITLEIARRVASVHGVEIQPQRVAAARRIARRQGVANATFEEGSVVDHPIETKGYDVVFCLGVIQHLHGGDVPPTVDRLVAAARRSVVIRAPFFRRSRMDLLGHCVNAIGRAGEGPRGKFKVRMVRCEGGIGGDFLVADRPEA
ncbi:MAG: class I SAM-dependent methyltransferase [Planctomycetota bacterium]